MFNYLMHGLISGIPPASPFAQRRRDDRRVRVPPVLDSPLSSLPAPLPPVFCRLASGSSSPPPLRRARFGRRVASGASSPPSPSPSPSPSPASPLVAAAAAAAAAASFSAFFFRFRSRSLSRFDSFFPFLVSAGSGGGKGGERRVEGGGRRSGGRIAGGEGFEMVPDFKN